MTYTMDKSDGKNKSKRLHRSRGKRQTDQPPLYQVDLSLPPEERHKAICQDYKHEIAQLVPLYEEILQLTPCPRLCDLLAKRLLRRVFSQEETREIRGISRVTGVPLHLVVAFNTFLDLFSGCTSGGARVADATSDRMNMRMVHFRGLDWEMEPLRRMVICVEYVREGQVIARCVYFMSWPLASLTTWTSGE